MDTRRTLSITDARKDIFDIAEDVQKPGVHYTLTERGRPKAVIMSAEEFESWQETIEVYRDFPNIKADLEKSRRAVENGDFSDYITLEELLEEEGLVLKEKEAKHEVSPRDKKKRTKKAR